MVNNITYLLVIIKYSQQEMLSLVKQIHQKVKLNVVTTGLKPAILTEEFCTFPQLLQVNVGIIPLNPWYSNCVPWNPRVHSDLSGVLQAHFLCNEIGKDNYGNF
jgi:hypothetical protein